MHPEDSSHRPPSEGVLGQVLRALFGKPEPERREPRPTERPPAQRASPEPSGPGSRWAETDTGAGRVEFRSLRDAETARTPSREPSLEYIERLESTALRDEDDPGDREIEGGVMIERPPPLTQEAPASETVDVAVAVAAPEPEQTDRTAGTDPRVLAELQHPAASTRIETLRKLRDDPDAAPVVAVTARLQDPDPRVREAAVGVLDAMADERVLLLLLDAMHDPSEQVRRVVRRAILDHAGPSLTDLLHRELAVPARCGAAAALLAEMGHTETLLRTLRDADPSTRTLITEALHGSGAIGRLIKELTDGRPDRRRVAAEQLGTMRAREATESLIERLEDPDRGVRIKVAEALGRIGDPRATHALKRSLVWDPDAGVVVAVAQALRKIAGGGDPRTVRV